MLKNLSIRASLSLTIAFFGVVLLIGAAAGLLSMRAGNTALQLMYTVDTPAVADLEGGAVTAGFDAKDDRGQPGR